MNPNELLRIVDSLHREKNIDPEIVFQAIEAALVSAAKRQYGEESEITVRIGREDGRIEAHCNGQLLDPEEMIGRIGAQSAKQVIIQKIREAERDSLYEEFEDQIGQMVGGVVQRNEGGASTVSLGNVEAILPRSEQIPGESHHPNERLRAVICDVRSQGNRVKVVLSRTRKQFVQRLFEQEIPEIADGVITINEIAREPGYRSKVAVSSSDQRVDCVGACVGVRGNRIKNIVDELAGERIDIVRWSDDPEVLIPNALQPAEVDQVLLCDMIGRAIVLVREDQLSLAIGRRGQNVRLASKLCGWDIEIMTAEELEDQIERAVAGFCEIEGMDEELAQRLVEQGYLSYDDLSVVEPDALMEMGGLTADQVAAIVDQAEAKAEEAERASAEKRRQQREAERQQAAAAAQAPDEAAADEAAADEAGADENLEAEAGEEAVDQEASAAVDEEFQEATGDEPDAGDETQVDSVSQAESSGAALGDDEQDEMDDATSASAPADDESEIRSNPTP
ncbi:MAG: transcription termination factor NusA [Pirellulaceae bacterium]|nr:transcription termination factor NusA [Pirellulaceae bacterium]